MKEFEYLKPESFDQLQNLITRYENAGIKFFAGGTDLIVQLKRNANFNFKYLIDLEKLNLNYIEYSKNYLKIGALTTLSNIENNTFLKENFPIFTSTTSKMASVQIRNKATIGGNLCNAAPSADLAPPLLVLDAKLKILSREKEKVVSIEEFFLGPGRTILSSSDILKEIILNIPGDEWTAVYIKSMRTSEDIATVGVAVKLSKDKDKNQYNDIKIALGAVAPTPIRIYQAEKFFLENYSKQDKQSVVEKIAEITANESKPIDDVRASANFRKVIIKKYISRSILSVLQKLSD
jgi:CO/xanthine dehydrogenase FAD-binding subunit